MPRGHVGAQEFTRQGLYVATFEPDAGATSKLGRQAADEVRDRIEKLIQGKDAQVITLTDARRRIPDLTFPLDTTYPVGVIETLVRQARGDEFVVGRVARRGGAYHLTGEFRLMRDRGTRQPISASAPKLEAAADQFARAVAGARAQLVPQRRCANAMMDHKADQAVAAARAGIQAYNRGAFARACLVSAMRIAGAPAGDLLTESRELLAIDSLSRQGLESAARAYDALKRRDEAAAMWTRLIATDSTNTAVIAFGIRGLLEGGNARRAEALVLAAAAENKEVLELQRLRWQVTFENRSWPRAVEAGELLLERDSLAVTDSTLYTRLATAHRANGNVLRAVELSARGVTRFPKDARLYALYAELVRAESDSVVPRGLALFPKSAEINTLAARDARAKGRLADAAEATRRAVEADSALPQGLITLAQAEFDLGRPDSALVALGRALARGEDSAMVAQFALAKGNALLRAAGQTKTRGDYARALRFFNVADSVRTSPQSKFLLGTAALQVASAALREAPQEKDKALSCALAREGAATVATARTGLEAGQELAPDAAKQYLEYVAQLEPFAQKQLATSCEGVPPAATTAATTPTR
ncbi:MAG: tetratricopeptide repeat protein [Gemmatirosa sp.]